jgi:hypothetical protein
MLVPMRNGFKQGAESDANASVKGYDAAAEKDESVSKCIQPYDIIQLGGPS